MEELFASIFRVAGTIQYYINLDFCIVKYRGLLQYLYVHVFNDAPPLEFV